MKHKLHRRTFAKLGVLTGAGAFLVPSWAEVAAAPIAPLDLTADERALIERFAEALIPTGGTSLKPLADVRVSDNVAHALSLLDPSVLEQVRVGFKLFDYGAVLIGFHFKRFSRLSVENRLDYIRRWEDGVTVQRGIVDLLKKLTYLGYWQDLEAGRAIEYLGPVSVAGGVPSLGNAPMPSEDGNP